MHFIYDDTSKPGGKFYMPDVDPNDMYLKHVENYLYLQLILKNDPSLVNRFQATKEIAICEKKLNWWSNRGGFDQNKIFQAILNLKKKWNMENVILPTPKSSLKPIKGRKGHR